MAVTSNDKSDSPASFSVLVLAYPRMSADVADDAKLECNSSANPIWDLVKTALGRKPAAPE